MSDHISGLKVHGAAEATVPLVTTAPAAEFGSPEDVRIILTRGIEPVATKTPVSLAAGVNAAVAAKTPLPPGLVFVNTDEIESPWLRCCLYGETDSRKTTTAAEFGSPEDVRIILTRGIDQLLPLKGLGYKALVADNVQKLNFACLYPEKVWPEWADRPNRTLIVDDITRGKDMILEDNETTDDGRELKDMRMVHREAKSDMGDLARSLYGKKMHLILVALASIYTNNITREETITPDLPPGMSRMLMADASFIFYADKVKNMLLTSQKRITYTARDDKGKEQSFTRAIMAKHKLPKALEGKGVIQEYEKMDLADLWKRITEAKGKK